MSGKIKGVTRVKLRMQGFKQVRRQPGMAQIVNAQAYRVLYATRQRSITPKEARGLEPPEYGVLPAIATRAGCIALVRTQNRAAQIETSKYLTLLRGAYARGRKC